ncbi:hypothetical protein JA1_001177 [Spathaspora sp. JA1]|nr:hypothetical protein JA1_001177 [Spathaspora sp. JA1]
MSQEKQPLNSNQITSLHLYDLAHSNPVSHELSQSYSLLFERHSLTKQINLPPLLIHKFCTGCGNLLIPGLTVSIRMKYPKKDKTNKTGESVSLQHEPGTRRLRYRCALCRYTTYDDSLIQEKSKKKKEQEETEKVEFKAEWTPDHTNQVKQTGSSSKNVKSKDRAKKRKLNSLSNLLSQKKKQKPDSNSLNLMDFLK